MEQLQAFKGYLSKTNDLAHAGMILNWDMETKMPKQGADAHIAALTTLSGEIFKRSTSEEMKSFLEHLTVPEVFNNLDDVSQKMILGCKEEYEQIKNIPEELYTRYVEVTSKSQHVWGEAKHRNDFDTMKPYFEEMVELNKEQAKYINPHKKVYDVLLNQYEKGITQEIIENIFNELRDGVVPLVEAIKEKQAFDESRLKGDFSKSSQKAFGEYLLQVMGYSLEAGRLDESEHPFTIGHAPKDVRITTNYDLTDIRSSAFSILHEGGHGLYEQHIHPGLIGTGLNTGTSMGIHESQSRFYENIVGRHKAFWSNHYAKVQALFPHYQNITLDEFYKGINVVTPSLVRVEADELTYNLHIIIRFEIEKALFDGSLEVQDLPTVWHDKMKHYLGVTPDCHKNGVLQDVHWPGGMFGYFPSYALGNIYGGQFLQQLQAECGQLDELLLYNQLDQVNDWLKTKVHEFGKLKTPAQIIQDVCGTGLDAKPILEYYTKKYSKIYNL